jgi:hypothetical protein
MVGCVLYLPKNPRPKEEMVRIRCQREACANKKRHYMDYGGWGHPVVVVGIHRELEVTISFVQIYLTLTYYRMASSLHRQVNSSKGRRKDTIFAPIGHSDKLTDLSIRSECWLENDALMGKVSQMLLPHVFVLPMEDFWLYVHSNITDYRLDRGSYYRLMWQLEPLNTEHHIDPNTLLLQVPL